MTIMSFIGDILSRLHAGGFPEAIVAGGALRDYRTGREHEVKDIDVFIEDKPLYLNQLNNAFAGWSHKLAVPERVAQYMQFEGVVCVQEYVSPTNAVPVQVIVMNRSVEPQSTIERHDFGACQVAFDGTRWYATEAFEKDLTDKTFTLVRCRDEKDRKRSLKRWERLSNKFTDWRLVC